MPIQEFEPFTDIPESELLQYIADLTREPNVVVVRQFQQPEESQSGEALWTVIAGRIITEAEAAGTTSSGGRQTGSGTADVTPSPPPTTGTASTSSVVPESWMPSCSMDRVICHWTAGEYKASDHDRDSYHILIEDNGRLVPGTHTIKDNVSTADNKYAAHTKGTNTRSIGVSVCCMSGAKSNPFNAGSYPMTKRQWDMMIDVVCDLCRRYNITPQPHTVLGHGEVEKNIGNPQDGKWDPMKLPWEPDLTFAEVGQLLRESVRAKL